MRNAHQDNQTHERKSALMVSSSECRFPAWMVFYGKSWRSQATHAPEVLMKVANPYARILMVKYFSPFRTVLYPYNGDRRRSNRPTETEGTLNAPVIFSHLSFYLWCIVSRIIHKHWPYQLWKQFVEIFSRTKPGATCPNRISPALAGWPKWFIEGYSGFVQTQTLKRRMISAKVSNERYSSWRSNENRRATPASEHLHR
jgi:hypothetical protein